VAVLAFGAVGGCLAACLLDARRQCRANLFSINEAGIILI